MKINEISVNLPLASFEELKAYKEKYWELRNELKGFLKVSRQTGIDYTFNVTEMIEYLKKLILLPNSSNVNIDIIYTKEKQGN